MNYAFSFLRRSFSAQPRSHHSNFQKYYAQRPNNWAQKIQKVGLVTSMVTNHFEKYANAYYKGYVNLCRPALMGAIAYMILNPIEGDPYRPNES